MSDRPTPETDNVAQPSSLLQYETVNANFARKLERERDEAREERDKLKQLLSADAENVDAYLGVCIERDEAMGQVKELIYIADRAIDLAEIDFENDKFGVVSELRDGLKKIKEASK
jgi:hypothetical protein